MDSVILNTPILWVLYGIALILCIIDIKLKAFGYIFHALSVGICIVASIIALFMGASLIEVAIVITIFLIVNLGVYRLKGGDK